jgi:hypothetical protein
MRDVSFSALDEVDTGLFNEFARGFFGRKVVGQTNLPPRKARATMQGVLVIALSSNDPEALPNRSEGTYFKSLDFILLRIPFRLIAKASVSSSSCF